MPTGSMNWCYFKTKSWPERIVLSRTRLLCSMPDHLSNMCRGHTTHTGGHSSRHREHGVIGRQPHRAALAWQDFGCSTQPPSRCPSSSTKLWKYPSSCHSHNVPSYLYAIMVHSFSVCGAFHMIGWQGFRHHPFTTNHHAIIPPFNCHCQQHFYIGLVHLSS